jgi:hypothetical protein
VLGAASDDGNLDGHGARKAKGPDGAGPSLLPG